MIFEISDELLFEMFRTDNLIRLVVTDGIPGDQWFDSLHINRHGNVEIHTADASGQVSEERKSITVTDLRGT